MSTSLVEDTSPESVVEKKGITHSSSHLHIGIPHFLHISSVSGMSTQTHKVHIYQYSLCSSHDYCFFFMSYVSSSSKVPACICHPPARQASVSTEAALYREGGPHLCPPFCGTIQTELQVFGTLNLEFFFFWTD